MNVAQSARESANQSANRSNPESAIEVAGVSVRYGAGLLRRSAAVTALRNVSLKVPAGVCHGLVGESGSGKTTLGRVILGLTPPSTGRVRVAGVDPARVSGADAQAFRRAVQCVFQDSGAVLNPRLSVGRSVREGLDIRRTEPPPVRDEAVLSLFRRVGLAPALATRFPHQLSGGQRQRVNLARALALSPKILVADEPLSALDVSVQAHILDLLAELRAEMGLTLLLITHDLKVAREICDTVSVLQAGEVVEHGPAKRLFSAPQHTYTQRLVESLPKPRFAL